MRRARRGQRASRPRVGAGASARASLRWATWCGARCGGTRRGRASWRARWATAAGACAGSARAPAASFPPRACSRSPRGSRRTTPRAPSTGSESPRNFVPSLNPRLTVTNFYGNSNRGGTLEQIANYEQSKMSN